MSDPNIWSPYEQRVPSEDTFNSVPRTLKAVSAVDALQCLEGLPKSFAQQGDPADAFKILSPYAYMAGIIDRGSQTPGGAS